MRVLVVLVLVLLRGVAVRAHQDDEASKIENVSRLSEDEASHMGGSVRGRVVVGMEEGRRHGRVQQQQLMATARYFNYSIKVEAADHQGECEEEGKDHLIIFFSRGEGVVQGEAGVIAASLVASGASIIIPPQQPHSQPLLQQLALVGWSRAVKEAIQATGAPSLTHLARDLLHSPSLRRRHRAAIDTHARLFYVIGQRDKITGGISQGDEAQEDTQKEGSKAIQENAPLEKNEKVEEVQKDVKEKEKIIQTQENDLVDRMKQVNEAAEGIDKEVNGITEKAEVNKSDDPAEPNEEKGGVEINTDVNKKMDAQVLKIENTQKGYRVRANNRHPPILVPGTESIRARTLLVAISDYLLLGTNAAGENIETMDVETKEALYKETAAKNIEEEIRKDGNKQNPDEERKEKLKNHKEGDVKETREDEDTETKAQSSTRREDEHNGEHNGENNGDMREADVGANERVGLENATGEEEEKLKQMRVVVGVFVRGPQPFLWESLGSLFQSGLHPATTHYYLHNQVPEYEEVVGKWVSVMRNTGANVTEVRPEREEAHVRNHLLHECRRLECDWYLSMDSIAFFNPGVLSRLLQHSTHPVIAPALRVQRGLETTFLRDLDPVSDQPAQSWDHVGLMANTQDARGNWHVSCVRWVYAVRSDVLEELTSPYTNPNLDPTHTSLQNPNEDPKPTADNYQITVNLQSESETHETDPKPSVDNSHHTAQNVNMFFCRALREAGVPMVMTTAESNLGVLMNVTGHSIETPNLASLASNPVIWHLAYLHPTWHQIMTGKVHLIRRPCPEVYQYTTFSQTFTQDLLDLAYQHNRWSPAVLNDQRKAIKLKKEAVPTVDQYLSDLGVGNLALSLLKEVLIHHQLLSFPYSNPSEVMLGLVARFRPGEVAGLPSHNDASETSFIITLSDQSEYKGGEIEFPRSGCRVRPDEGDVLVFPGRMTHPKIFHNVTSGTLHTLIIHIDNSELRHLY